MKYISFDDEDSVIGPATWFFELDGDGYPVRQLLVGEDEIVASNWDHPECGFFLAEGAIPEDLMADADEIEKDEFEEAWAANLKHRAAAWKVTKTTHAKGAKVRGTLNCLFPQGPIVTLGNDAAAVVISGPALDASRVGGVVEGTVGGYDDVNQWVLLRDASEVKAARK
jgi:hypothetical protein